MYYQLLNRYKLTKSYILRSETAENYPVELVLELTNRCNMNCTICPRDKMNRPLGDISFDLFKKIVDEIKGKTEMLDLCFAGESLLHKEVFKMIKHAKQNGIRTFIQTNAMNLDREIARQIIDSGLDLLVLSIDAINKDTYNLIRSGGNFNLVIKNAEEFLKLKNANSRKPFTIAQMIYTEYNKNEVKDFYYYWKSRSADAVRIKPFNSRAGLVGVGLPTYLEEKKDFHLQRPCIRLWRGLAIFWDGRVVPCCMDYQGKYILGDLNKQNILDIWNSDKMQYLRKLHISGRIHESELCKYCEGYSAGVIKTFGATFFNALTIRKLAPIWNKFYNAKN